MATVGEVRVLALSLPRTTEHLIHDRVKFRIGLLDHEEMTERVTEAWTMCVPRFLVRSALGREQ